jgi:hypothetical protein
VKAIAICQSFEAALPSLFGSGLMKRKRPPPVTSEILVAVQTPFSNFGLAARQSKSVLICSGLACSPACLRAICFDSFISEDRNYALNVCSSDTNKNTNKVGGWIRMRTNNDEQQGTLKALFFKGF